MRRSKRCFWSGVRDVEPLEIEFEARLAHQLAHRVRAVQPEPRRTQATFVQAPLHVPVRVDAGRLREHVLSDDRHYTDLGPNFYATRHKEQAAQNYVKRLAKLGFNVTLTMNTDH